MADNAKYRQYLKGYRYVMRNIIGQVVGTLEVTKGVMITMEIKNGDSKA